MASSSRCCDDEGPTSVCAEVDVVDDCGAHVDCANTVRREEDATDDSGGEGWLLTRLRGGQR